MNRQGITPPLGAQDGNGRLKGRMVRVIDRKTQKIVGFGRCVWHRPEHRSDVMIGGRLLSFGATSFICKPVGE